MRAGRKRKERKTLPRRVCWTGNRWMDDGSSNSSMYRVRTIQSSSSKEEETDKTPVDSICVRATLRTSCYRIQSGRDPTISDYIHHFLVSFHFLIRLFVTVGAQREKAALLPF